MKTNLTPNEIAKSLDNLLGTKVGLQIGSEVVPGGAITRLTESGKTIKTDRGLVFKFRRSLGRFTLRGVPEAGCVVYRENNVIHRVLAKRRGRPLGSKNKPKQAEVQAETQVKRGPGRPKGSRNKAKLQATAPQKRGPGRPKGSRNKPKLQAEAPVRRGRGRPKGSKNKPKVQLRPLQQDNNQQDSHQGAA